MNAQFAKIRQAAPSIHVFRPAGRFDEGGVTVLKRQDDDAQYDSRPYSKDYVKGDGTREKPYRYLSAAPVSPHYAVVDLWYRFCSKTVFIEVNGWLLAVSPEGVTAADGRFTKLA